MLPGVVAGVLASLGLSRKLAGGLFRIRRWNPGTCVRVAAALPAVTAAASYRRAGRADSVEWLR